jgi:hypothetical protein
MVDPPVSISMNSTLAARVQTVFDRGFIATAPLNLTISAPSNLRAEDGIQAGWIFALLLMVFVTILLLLFCLSPKWLFRRAYDSFSQVFVWEWLDGFPSLNPPYYLKRLIAIWATLFFAASWVVVVMHLQKQQRWSAASEFLAACKMQKVRPCSFG